MILDLTAKGGWLCRFSELKGRGEDFWSAAAIPLLRFREGGWNLMRPPRNGGGPQTSLVIASLPLMKVKKSPFLPGTTGTISSKTWGWGITSSMTFL
jgi:hypothetical protein